MRDVDDIGDLAIVLSRQRRLEIMRILMERGSMDVAELRRALGVPLSTLYYDIEVLRANGLVMKVDGAVALTSRGRALMERLMQMLGPQQPGRPVRLGQLADIVMLRPLVVYLARVDPLILAVHAVTIILAGSLMAMLRGFDMSILLFFKGLNAPYTIAASVLAYVGISIAVFKGLSGGEPVDVGLVSMILTSMTPPMLYPSIDYALGLLRSVEAAHYISVALWALLPAISIIMLATYYSIRSGRPIEITALALTLSILLPSTLTYLFIVNYVL